MRAKFPVRQFSRYNNGPKKQPYKKEIYVNSNHPYIIKKEIPNMIQKRLSSLSKTKDIFDKAKCSKNSGYNTKLEFDKNCNIALKKRRTTSSIVILLFTQA